MFARIPVPLDGSRLAERVLPAAAGLARATHGPVHLAHAVEPLLPDPEVAARAALPAEPPAALRTAAEAVARAYLDAARAPPELDGLAVDVQVLRTDIVGGTAGVLLDHERDVGIALTVLSSHGQAGQARFALGSITERLLRYGTATLLLLRASGAPPSLDRVLVPLDGSACCRSRRPPPICGRKLISTSLRRPRAGSPW